MPDAVAGAIVEGTLLAAYRYSEFKSDPGEDRAPAELIVSAHHDVARAVELGRVGAEAANRARDLMNAPPNAMTPEALAEHARALPGVTVEVWAAPRSRRPGWARSPRSRRARRTSRA